jgi:hypothetical protein
MVKGYEGGIDAVAGRIKIYKFTPEENSRKRRV